MPFHSTKSVHDFAVRLPRQLIARVRSVNGNVVAQGLLSQFVGALRTLPIPPAALDSMIQTLFIVRAKDVSGAGLVNRIWPRFHNTTPFCMFSRHQHIWKKLKQ